VTSTQSRKDLVVLTADKNAQFAIRGILSRRHSLGIRELNPDYLLHPGKDPGVLHTAHEFLRAFTKVYAHALVLMDREGSGRDALPRLEMEARIEKALGQSGWDDRAAVVAIDPELDVWVWSDSPHVDRELGWSHRQPGLRSWLTAKGFLVEGAVKPEQPKEALEAALREVRKPRSSALYEALAIKVSLAKCTDLAFVKLRTVLRGWFSEA
jgi:hypothetical protein